MLGVGQSWKQKAAVDALKAILPFQDSLRQLKRRISPYATNPMNDKHLLGDALRQLSCLATSGFDLVGKDAVEIGTGWNPVLPFMIRMAGARHVTTVDQECLLDMRGAQRAWAVIAENVAAVAQQLGVQDRHLELAQISVAHASLADALKASCIEYRAPFNFLSLPVNTADLIVSRDVLEHVPTGLLVRIFIHAQRILRDGGYMCHYIDLSDHWEHVDKSISKVNFLQYEDLPWSLTGLNPQNYQNRLRLFEYVELMECAGFDVIVAESTTTPATCEALKTLPLAKRYQSIALEKLAVTGALVIAKKKAELSLSFDH